MNTQPTTEQVFLSENQKEKLAKKEANKGKEKETVNNSVILYKTAKVDLQDFTVSFTVSEVVKEEKRQYIKTIPVELATGMLKEQVVEFINESVKSLGAICAPENLQKIESDIRDGHIRTALLTLKGIIETPKGLQRKDGKNPFNPNDREEKTVSFFKVNEESFSVMVATKNKTFVHFAAYSYAIRNKSVEPLVFVFKDTENDIYKKSTAICRFSHPDTKPATLEQFLEFYQNVLVKRIADKKLAEFKKSGLNRQSFFVSESKKMELQRKGISTARGIVETLEKFENKYQSSMRKYAKIKNGEKIPVATFEDSVATPHK